MEPKFKIDDIVRVRDIGTVWMKVIKIDYDFDEEGNTHLISHLLDVLSAENKSQSEPKIDEDFDEESHKIYKVICEWYDSNGESHVDKFEETKLENLKDVPNPPSWTIIEGFVRKKP